MTLSRKAAAEFLGTAWLVFGRCGSAVLASKFLDLNNGNINLGISFLGISVAFGLTVLTMAYAIGHISGCHLNPAVSLGLVAGGRFDAKDLPAYMVAQVLGGIAGAAVLFLIASGNADFKASDGFSGLRPCSEARWADLLTSCWLQRLNNWRKPRLHERRGFHDLQRGSKKDAAVGV